MVQMKQTKMYEILNFDVSNIKLIKNIVTFFTKEIKDVKIVLFYETTGFYEHVNLNEFSIKLEENSKKYTGLDEIALTKNDLEIVVIIFHEGFCILTIDEDIKKAIEKTLQVKLIEYKK